MKDESQQKNKSNELVEVQKSTITELEKTVKDLQNKCQDLENRLKDLKKKYQDQEELVERHIR